MYCNNHVPRSRAGNYDSNAIGIRTALSAPKASTPRHPYSDRAYFDSDAVAIRAALSAPKPWYVHDRYNLEMPHDRGTFHIPYQPQQTTASRTSKRVGKILETPMPVVSELS